jgi:diguanylate cyclase (GGDEF)-like protein
MAANSIETTMRCEATPASAASERRPVLTLLSGPKSGTTVAVPVGEFTIGRGNDAHLCIEDELLSRQHARIVSVLDRHFIEDLDSTNGTRIDETAVTALVPLADGAIIHLGPNTLLRFSLRDTAEVIAVQRIYEATVRDALTGLYNRQFLDERLAAEFAYARRHQAALSVLFVDADHFKRVNDTFGHAAGDEVLRSLGGFLRRAMRAEDIVARYGGEEFVIVLRTVSREGVLIAADRIRAGIESLYIENDGESLSITVSVGVATVSATRDYDSPEALIAAADAALYKAKQLGRNRVVSD